MTYARLALGSLLVVPFVAWAAWPRHAQKKVHHPDNPLAALEQRSAQQRDGFGHIPVNGLVRGQAQMKRLRADSRRAPSPITRGEWTWLGPGNIGGRVRSILVNPADPQVLWAGSVGGGIWKTTDGAASWRPLDDFMASLAVSSMVLDHANPDVLYAGTGEGFFPGNEPFGDFQRGAGVFKSTDGGTTWNQVPATATADFSYVVRLAIHPGDPRILLAATKTGIFRTTDGGATWPMAYPQEMRDLRFNPVDGSHAVAGSLGEALYSNDAGVTWRLAHGLPAARGPGTPDAGGSVRGDPSSGRVELAYAKSSPNVVYASVDLSNGELYKSTDGGQNYVLVNRGANYFDAGAGDQGDYDSAIWVDPTNPDIVIVGGINLFRSTDGGVTLTPISDWSQAPRSPHADQHVIVEHPGFDGVNQKTVYFGNDGGLYKTSDVYAASVPWQVINNNFGVTQFYGGAGNASAGVIVAGAQDNGTLRYGGNPQSWTEMNGGDGGFCAADPTDPNVYYGEYVFLTIARSNNGGRTARDIYSGISDAEDGTALFIAPFILDPNQPTRMLAGGASLWRSEDVKTPAAPTWTRIKPPIGGVASQGGEYISAIAVAEGDPDSIWVGYDDGWVYRTTNGTSASPTWTLVPMGASQSGRYVTRITIDRRRHDVVYVTYGGFAPQGVIKSEDGGATWRPLTGTGAGVLPEVPVRSLVVSPNNPSWLYAGTEVGLFASEDAGATWRVPGEGPANVSVDELFWMKATLVAVTHGRGVFKQATCTAGAECDDGNVCTTGTTCDADEVCGGGQAMACDDGDPCTVDACDPVTGCTHGAPMSCDDGNPCTDDTCGPTGCMHTNNTAACDDQDACTTGEVCADGHCGGGTPLSCDDDDPCTNDSCDPASGCQHHPSRRTGCGGFQSQPGQPDDPGGCAAAPLGSRR